jgi:predicted TIM-barrel fold metal-dependent hydrolase
MQIDSHQHFWQIARGDYHWMSPDLVPLYRDYGPDDLAPVIARQAAHLEQAGWPAPFEFGRQG